MNFLQSLLIASVGATKNQKWIQTHVVVEIQRRVLPAAVENVGVNGYVSEHGIHQPNVTNYIQYLYFFTLKEKIFLVFFFFWGQQEVSGSFGSKKKRKRKTINGKNKKVVKVVYQNQNKKNLQNDKWCDSDEWIRRQRRWKTDEWFLEIGEMMETETARRWWWKFFLGSRESCITNALLTLNL